MPVRGSTSSRSARITVSCYLARSSKAKCAGTRWGTSCMRNGMRRSGSALKYDWTRSSSCPITSTASSRLSTWGRGGASPVPPPGNNCLAGPTAPRRALLGPCSGRSSPSPKKPSTEHGDIPLWSGESPATVYTISENALKAGP